MNLLDELVKKLLLKSVVLQSLPILLLDLLVFSVPLLPFFFLKLLAVFLGFPSLPLLFSWY